MKINGIRFLLIGLAAVFALQGCGGGEEGGGTVAPVPTNPPVNPNPNGDLPYSPNALNACNNQTNDNSKTNASGNCLKVAAPSGGTYYTSTPSKQVIDNTSASYSSLYTESGSRGPAGGEFARLNESERDSWCNHLANIGFVGRANWTVANETQLMTLRTSYSLDIYGRLGWPAGQYYAGNAISGSPQPGEQAQIDLESSNRGFGMGMTLYVSCISTP